MLWSIFFLFIYVLPFPFFIRVALSFCAINAEWGLWRWHFISQYSKAYLLAGMFDKQNLMHRECLYDIESCIWFQHLRTFLILQSVLKLFGFTLMNWHGFPNTCWSSMSHATGSEALSAYEQIYDMIVSQWWCITMYYLFITWYTVS